MAITTKTQSGLVSGQVAAMQGSNSGLIDFALGTVLLAITQAVAEVGLWLQAIVLQLVIITRAATSTGSDLDSFVADFGVTRLPAVAASGQVTLSRFSTGAQVVVAVGASIETPDGTQTVTVPLDTTNAAYNAGLGGYVLTAGTASVTVKATNTVAGAGGNVAAGTLTVISGAIPGIDTATNSAPFTNGADAESDPALRVRFVSYINSRAQGTPVAVEYAVASVQQGLTYDLVENYAYTGLFQPGYFYFVIDDGSGYPPGSLLTSVTTAIQAAAPLCSQFGVYAPVIVPITIVMTRIGGNTATISAAISAYVTGLGLGQPVVYTKLSQVAYNADPNVTDVVSVTLNGGSSDIAISPQQRALPSSVSVT